MIVNQYSEAVYDIDEIIEFQVNGVFGTVITDDVNEIEKLKRAGKRISNIRLVPPTDGMTPEEFHKTCSERWSIPDEYLNMDIESYLLDLCIQSTETNRVKEELSLYNELGLVNVLRLMKYIVDNLRKNDIVWGVGRGSSVSSYCLYLLGVHKVNSIKYDLDISEFLRKE